MKRPFQMSRKELGAAHEQRVASVLNGRVQKGSGSVKVPFMRGDVIASPFMIECKSTKETYINVMYSVWEDIVNKSKETTFYPSYALSVCDRFGNFYDVIGVDIKLLPPRSLLNMTSGSIHAYTVKSTTKVSIIEECVKQRKYFAVTFEKTAQTLVFVPLQQFANEFQNIIKGL